MEELKKNITLYQGDQYNMEDLEERRLYINDVIDSSVIDEIVYHILRYNRLDKDKPANERSPIILYINSPGGDVYPGYALISVIQDSITPIYTVNQGMCASMAFLIFLAGTKRFSMRNSTFLMHDGSSGMGFESTAKMRDRMEFETGQLEELTKQFVLEHTSITSEYYDEKYRIEWYMLPDEAKSHNICDYIVGKDCTIDEII